MKQFAIKFALFLALIVGGQSLLLWRGCEEPYPRIVAGFDKQLNKGIQIVGFGDSVIRTCAPADTNRAPIGQLLAEELPRRWAGFISNGGYNSEVYLNYCRFLVRQRHRPRVVIIEMNPAAFSDTPYPFRLFIEEAAALFRKDRFLLNAFYKPLCVFHFTFLQPSITPERFWDSTIYDRDRPVGKVRDFDVNSPVFQALPPDERLRHGIINSYMYPMTARGRRVVNLQKIADLLRRKHIRTVFYITPVDWQKCEQIMPDGFAQELDRKVGVLKAALAARQEPVLDLSRALTADFFTPDFYLNEHLNERGRQFVADQLAVCVKERLQAARDEAK